MPRVRGLWHGALRKGASSTKALRVGDGCACHSAALRARRVLAPCVVVGFNSPAVRRGAVGVICFVGAGRRAQFVMSYGAIGVFAGVRAVRLNSWHFVPLVRTACAETVGRQSAGRTRFFNVWRTVRAAYYELLRAHGGTAAPATSFCSQPTSDVMCARRPSTVDRRLRGLSYVSKSRKDECRLSGGYSNTQFGCCPRRTDGRPKAHPVRGSLDAAAAKALR